MLVDAGANTDGGASYLNDGLGANASTLSTIAITTASKASDAIQVIDRALQDIASERANLGAVSNRLDHTISNLGNVVINTEASQSRIEDADFAKVTGDLTKSQIMSQAATAMLAQANASKQGVLSLLQG
jgi:flagellin